MPSKVYRVALDGGRIARLSASRASVPDLPVCEESAGDAFSVPYGAKPCHLCRQVAHVLMISKKNAAGPLSKASARLGGEGFFDVAGPSPL